MDGLVIGYDLCDDYSQISYMKEGDDEPQAIEFGESLGSFLLPTSICKKRGENEWLIGEDAYRAALLSEGIMVDKLLKLVAKNGTATIEGHCYQAAELFEIFFRKTIEFLKETLGNVDIEHITFSMEPLNTKLMDLILSCMSALDIDESKVSMSSHSEAFLFYASSQKHELWTNQTGLFDLSEDGLRYYEMQVVRGTSPAVIKVTYEPLEEGFSLDILDTPSGGKLADSILSSCAERLLTKKVFSAIYLSGKGFLRYQEWANQFLKSICGKRRVFVSQSIFAKGAAYMAKLSYEKEDFPYICLCEGRVPASVFMQVIYKGQPHQITLAHAGSTWYKTGINFSVIPEKVDTLEFTVTPAGCRERHRVEIPLSQFPKRPPKTTRLGIGISFLADTEAMIEVTDFGFGDQFPATYVKATKKLILKSPLLSNGN